LDPEESLLGRFRDFITGCYRPRAPAQEISPCWSARHPTSGGWSARRHRPHRPRVDPL